VPLALADSAREGSARVLFSFFFSYSFSLFQETELASSVRRHRCSRAAAASRKSIWYHGLLERRPQRSAAITVLLPAGFCGCTSARRSLPYTSLSSPDTALRTRRSSPDVACKQRKCVINAVARDLRKAAVKVVEYFSYLLGFTLAVCLAYFI